MTHIYPEVKLEVTGIWSKITKSSFCTTWHGGEYVAVITWDQDMDNYIPQFSAGCIYSFKPFNDGLIELKLTAESMENDIP